MTKTAQYDPARDSSAGTEDLREDEVHEGQETIPGIDGVILVTLNADGDKTCLCGCLSPVTSKRTFRQGHDQRLRGILIRANLHNAEVTVRGGMQTSGDAMSLAVRLDSQGVKGDWVESLHKAEARDAAKAAKAETRANQRATKHATAAQIDAAMAAGEAAAPATIAGTVKIGRWEYPAEQRGDRIVRNAKRDGSGEWIPVTD